MYDKKQYDKEYRKRNLEKLKQQAAERYQQNREVEIAKNKKWREENKERRQQYDKLWYDQNRERKTEIDKQYRGRNKELCKERCKLQNNKPKSRARKQKYERERDKSYYTEYRRQNSDKINAKVRKRDALKIRAVPKWFEKEKVDLLYTKSIYLSVLLNKQIHVDHIIPLTSETVCGLHCWDNLQLLDKSLNSSKHNYYQQDW